MSVGMPLIDFSLPLPEHRNHSYFLVLKKSPLLKCSLPLQRGPAHPGVHSMSPRGLIAACALAFLLSIAFAHQPRLDVASDEVGALSVTLDAVAHEGYPCWQQQQFMGHRNSPPNPPCPHTPSKPLLPQVFQIASYPGAPPSPSLSRWEGQELTYMGQVVYQEGDDTPWLDVKFTSAGPLKGSKLLLKIHLEFPEFVGVLGQGGCTFVRALRGSSCCCCC